MSPPMVSQSPSGSSASSRSLTSSTGSLACTLTLAVGLGLDRRLLAVELVDDLAHQLLDEVLERDQAGGAAVLVDHDRHVELLGLHLGQQLGDALGLGHEAGLSHQLGHQLGVASVALGPHQVLGVDDADDVVDALAADGHPAAAVEEHDLHHVGDPEVAVDGDHVGSGHHHLAHDRVAELDDLAR